MSSSSISAVQHIACRRRLPPRITVVKRGRDNLAPWTYTLSEISYFIDILELIVPSDSLGWQDTASVYNANASALRQRSASHLNHLYDWVCVLSTLALDLANSIFRLQLITKPARTHAKQVLPFYYRALEVECAIKCRSLNLEN
jgi:hypothetical protein